MRGKVVYRGAIQEERFEYKGFPCVVVMQAAGFRTGYVGLGRNNRYYKVRYNEIPVSCHGGLTYSDSYLVDQNDKDMWWIGYDTNHYGDGKDYDSAMWLFREYKESLDMLNRLKELDASLGLNYGVIATLEYCKNQCKGIVDQLLEEVGDTFCCDSKCRRKSCERHYNNIKEHSIDHSFSFFAKCDGHSESFQEEFGWIRELKEEANGKSE